ncbi:laccase [Suillus discolor]|uniref:Laccase n=1 Tax=Suillus discolor TaxID=1912936 RepID=A0A9P7JP49_9AGAM|nr:laccase [Suillus discolor]KAG2095736.1 laccase [Suillus discolor]
MYLSSLATYAAVASIFSPSQSYLLTSRSLGPSTDLTISNKVIAPDGFPRSTTLAGGTFPGPLIKANKGDHFAINVVNKLDDSFMLTSTSVHWHGLFQNGTNYADGVSFVTQCPIPPNYSFLHAFDAPNQAGTYWYHSHYSTQQCDGLRGPLVIYDPDDPLSYLYDVDDETTIISIADWYHTVSTVLRHIIGVDSDSTLINGLGRYVGGPESELAVVNVEYGKRYRLRLIGMSCDPSFKFSIDGHNLTVIETDGILTEPLLVDSLRIFAGQRYSVILTTDKPVNNYWLRALPSTAGSTFDGGLNCAILRYRGAPAADPTTDYTDSTMPMLETNLYPLINPGAPGIPEYGQADINLDLVVDNFGRLFFINGAVYEPPIVPVLLQILSGAQYATDLMPIGSVIVLEANKVVELTMTTHGFGAPHPIHLHGHTFDVVYSGGASDFNYLNPMRRDVASSGATGETMVIRWVTDNSGPWFLHCHIDWHLDGGFAIVMAESPSETQTHLKGLPTAWEDLCHAYYSSKSQSGAVDSYTEAANITTLLLPDH